MILFTCALMLPSSNSCWSRISSGSFLLSDVKLSGFWFADVVLKGLVKVFDFLEWDRLASWLVAEFKKDYLFADMADMGAISSLPNFLSRLISLSTSFFNWLNSMTQFLSLAGCFLCLSFSIVPPTMLLLLFKVSWLLSLSFYCFNMPCSPFENWSPCVALVDWGPENMVLGLYMQLFDLLFFSFISFNMDWNLSRSSTGMPTLDALAILISLFLWDSSFMRSFLCDSSINFFIISASFFLLFCRRFFLINLSKALSV